MVENVDATVKDDILTIKIDLKQDHGKTKSGKTIRIASTLGFMDIEDGIILSLNCNKKISK